jgi:putative transposase
MIASLPITADTASAEALLAVRQAAKFPSSTRAMICTTTAGSPPCCLSLAAPNLFLPTEEQAFPPHAIGGWQSVRERTRQYYCIRFDKSPVPLSDKKLGEFIEAVKNDGPDGHTVPSPGSVRRWVSQRGAPGNRKIACMRDKKTRGTCGPRLLKGVEAYIAEAVEAHFASPRRKTTRTVEEVWVAIKKHNLAAAADGKDPLPYPSASTIKRRIRSAMSATTLKRKFGPQKAAAFMPVQGHLKAERPMEIVQIDHTLLDIHLVDEETGLVWGRPTICVALDVATRAVVAFHLNIRAPSIETLRGVIRQMVRPKKAWLDRHFLSDQNWPMHGLPRQLLMDNGIEGMGRSFLGACEDHAIEVHIAPVATPQYKGAVERFFRTLNDFIHELPGGVSANPVELRARRFDPAKDATFSLRQLERLITRFITSVYHRRGHTALSGQCPNDVWAELVDLYPQPLAQKLDQIDCSFGELERRKLGRKGISLENLQYSGPALAGLLEDLLPDAGGTTTAAASVEVDVRITPDDLGTVAVFNPKRLTYVTLQCTDQESASGVPRNVWKDIHKFRSENTGNALNNIEKAVAKSQVFDSAAELARSNRRRDRKAALTTRRRENSGVASIGVEPEKPEPTPDQHFSEFDPKTWRQP